MKASATQHGEPLTERLDVHCVAGLTGAKTASDAPDHHGSGDLSKPAVAQTQRVHARCPCM